MIERTFKDIPDGKISDADEQSFLVSLGWWRGSKWDDLLRSKRVLIVSEAGSGKTYECRKQWKRLWDAGEPAFFVELAALATEDFYSQLDSHEEARLSTWLASQSEMATFFLDSIDELKLTSGSFDRALKRLGKCIGGHLHRARIVITTRPVQFDEQLIRSALPVPQVPSSVSGEEVFARVAMGEDQERHDSSKNQSADWRCVALMPLSEEQIVDFCRHQKISDPVLLLEDLQRRNALEFARRPQDLIELCVDWREHKRVRTHSDQVFTNVRVKLLPRDDRPEPAELSVDRAVEGAARLALAAQTTRRLTIRHSAASDSGSEQAALDPAIILSDWKPNERKALLERPLFGFASYGRVRFHHRSVAEYLAAERLVALRKQGMSFSALKRLLFTETKGKTIVRPSKRSLAGWLALKEDAVFQLLRDNEPSVLLNEGDPESLTQTQRNQALRAYAGRYGSGGWRGIRMPHVQVHRFASKELAEEIDRIWKRGVENPDVREVLISLIEAGRIEACADIVLDITRDAAAPVIERVRAIDALVNLDDRRLEEVSACIANGDEIFGESISRGAVPRLFPRYMSVEQLCRALRWIKEDKGSLGGLAWQLARVIRASKLGLPFLEGLRDGLLSLVSEGIRWRQAWPHINSDRSYLSEVLAATCECGLSLSQDDKWLHAAVVALRLNQPCRGHDEQTKSLRERLSNLAAEDNARLFWIDDAFLQGLHEFRSSYERLVEIVFNDGPVQLRLDRDITWVSEALGDTTRSVDARAILLEVAMFLAPGRDALREHVEAIRPLVVDQPSFVKKLDDSLKPSRYEREYQIREKKRAEHKEKEERRRDKNRASWIKFWREVANQPESAFSAEKSRNTAWNLWRAMRRDGDYSRSSGWNRRFIEEQFDQRTADRLRRVMMSIWRTDFPTFPSERPEGERNTVLARWQLGLAAVYAEAEDSGWATKLGYEEAQLATRYALIELNGLPQWVGSLVEAHPSAVDGTLGNELSWELGQSPSAHGYPILLQGIDYAPASVAELFLPRLESWLDSGDDWSDDADSMDGLVKRTSQVTRFLLKHGGVDVVSRLRAHALQRLDRQLPQALRLVWLSTLMQIDPLAGVERLEVQVEVVEPSERSDAVTWLASLFGDRQGEIGLGDERFTPRLLLRLLRLAYLHVRIQDDAHREGGYSPDTRDDAEQARNNIVTALLNVKGEEGLAAKLEMAEDPLFAHFKDRILAVAEENWAHEVDAEVFDQDQAVKLDLSAEAPPSTNESMFAILKDRLSGLDELLLRDDSPREVWAGISDEKVMRRVIARELGLASNSIYTVDQEAVTADEKETDIRLRSVLSKHEAVIELKLGNGRTAKDLIDAIENQLVRKYMAAEHSKAGALLVTVSKDRKWKHPVEDRKINADQLLSLLVEEADRVQRALGGRTYIHVHLLDLRPRLPIESQAKP